MNEFEIKDFNSHTREGVTPTYRHKKGHTHYMGDYCVSIQKMSIDYLLYIGICAVFFCEVYGNFRAFEVR